jgi:hypothetical protein
VCFAYCCKFRCLQYNTGVPGHGLYLCRVVSSFEPGHVCEILYNKCEVLVGLKGEISTWTCMVPLHCCYFLGNNPIVDLREANDWSGAV